MNRRGFIRWLAHEASAISGELKGTPHRRLANIRNLPESTIKRLKPSLLPDVSVAYTSHELSIRRHGKLIDVSFLANEPARGLILQRFDGERDIGSICAAVASSYEVPEREAFDRVTEMFAKLVDLGICVPINTGEE